MVFLEHMVSKEELKVDLQKVKAVTKCCRPINALRLETVWVSRELSSSGRIWQILFSLTNLLKEAIKLARRLTGGLCLLTTQAEGLPTHDMELAAVVFVVKIWRHYLYGVPCRINTDCQSVKHIFSQKRLNLHETSVVADLMSIKKAKYCGRCLNRKAQHTLNTVVTTQLDLLRELEDLDV